MKWRVRQAKNRRMLASFTLTGAMPSIALLAPAALLLASAGALQVIRGRANIDRIVLGVGSAQAANLVPNPGFETA